MQLCDYGCGREAQFQFKNGKWCCSKYSSQCPEMKKKNGDGNRGRKRPDISNFMKGNKYSLGRDPWNKGKKTGPLSEDHKEKIRKSSIGIKKPGTSEKLKGRILGPRSKESKRKQSISMMGKNKGVKRPEHSKRMMGKNNPFYGIRLFGKLNGNWKGGTSYDPYCPLWTDQEYKDSIRERDDYKCLNPKCSNNCNHFTLELHHINYDKQDCHPKNLITLCKSCNSRANKDRDWHQKYYEAILHRRYGYEY